jgi:brefeldin A-inhibited guanine nucleotide-exchange protein
MENKTNNDRFQFYQVNLKQMFEKVKKIMTKKHIHYNDLTNQLKDINEKIINEKEINIDKYFNLIKMSLETDNIKLIEAVLDHMHKLIKEDLFTGQSEETLVDKKTLKKFNYFYLKKRYIDSFIQSLVKLYNISDDNILLQVVMILYSICKNLNTNIHNESVLTIFRFYIRVYLASRTAINVDTTKSTLNCIVSLFYSRMEQFNAVIFARESASKVSTLIDIQSNFECEKSDLSLNIGTNSYLNNNNNNNNNFLNQEFQRRNTSNYVNTNFTASTGNIKTSNLSNMNVAYSNSAVLTANNNNNPNNHNVFNTRASANFGFNTEAFGASAYSNSTNSIISNITNSNTINNLNALNINNNNNINQMNYLINNNNAKQNFLQLYQNPVDTMLQKQMTSIIDDVCLINEREVLLSSLKKDTYTFGSEEQKTENFAFFKSFSTSLKKISSKALLLKSTPESALSLTSNFGFYERIFIANPLAKNEKGCESGLFGWCYICRSKADFYCNQTRLPVCSLNCKLKISEEDEEISNYVSGEILYEDDIALLYLSDAQNIFAFLCKLVNSSIDSNEANNTKAKLIALELILNIFEKPGNIFTSNREFINIIKADLIEGLLKACMSEDLQIYSFSIKIFFKVWNFFREYLKHQISVFIETVFLKILDSGNSTYDHKWLLMENFYKLAGTAKFFVELYVNYDCDIEEKDLLNRIVTSLSKISQGKYAKLEHQLSPQQEYQLRSRSLEVICMMIRSVLMFAQDQIGNSNAQKIGIFGTNLENEMQNNLNDENYNFDDNASFMLDTTLNYNITNNNLNTINNSNNNINNHNYEAFGTSAAQAANANIIREKLDHNRKIKSDISTAVEKFNIKVKNGILYMKKTGIVNKENKDLEAHDIANFLKNTHGLKKENVGEFLGENHEVALKTLDYYTQTFDFGGSHIIEAIRIFLSGFQLPGEGQKIDRIMEKFAAKYYKDNTDKFETADCAYYLAFSIIMLQTDTHHPKVKKKMGVEGFKKMIKGINGGKDLDDEFIKDVYLQILQKPISLLEYEEAKDKLDANKNKIDLYKRETERMFQEGTERLKKNQEKFYLKICEIDHISLMLESIWTCLLAMFSLIMEDSEDPNMTNLSIEGIR